MPKATVIRQRTRKASEEASRSVAQRSLARAFTSFTQAAGSLEKSYLQLQGEVAHLHEELHRTNAELQKTLECEPIYRACWKVCPAEYWLWMPTRKRKSSILRPGGFWRYRPIGLPA